MDRIQKALAWLSEKERKVVFDVLSLILLRKIEHMDVKKLVGRSDIFRVRKGDIRILFRMEGNETSILAIERRSEKTYRGK